MRLGWPQGKTASQQLGAFRLTFAMFCKDVYVPELCFRVKETNEVRCETVSLKTRAVRSSGRG